jgi:rubrerythrin
MEEEIMAEKPVVTKTDVLRILEICRDIEVCASELYHYFEEIFIDNPEISKLWRKTALEEENHANQFVLAIKLRSQGLVQAVSIDQNTAETILNQFRSLYEAMRQSKPTIADALILAIKLEERLSEYHMSTLALFQEESQKKLFEAMMKNDCGHVDELEKAYRKVMATQN